VVLAGLAADSIPPSMVVGIFGGVGVLVAVAAATAYYRARHAVSITTVEA
jgi:hypothetical protein